VSRVGRALVVVALAATFSFLLLPLLAIFVRVPPATLLAQLGSPVAVDALLVSLETSLIAHVVLPPAVAGVALLAAFGRRGLLGGELSALGISLPFTQAAVVVAVVFVASPFYVRQAITAFEAVDPAVVEAARTLGAGPFRTFGRVVLPLAAGGLGAGSALAFARGLGEFGATIIFAGSLEGVTQTLPLAVYAQLDQDLDAALAIGALLVVVSAGILVGVKLLPPWERFVSISPSPFAPSSLR
jgi:molybdate transport system permease protein